MIAKILVFAAALAAAAPVAAQSARAGRSEVYISPVFAEGKDYTFEGGTTAKTDTGFGITFGYAHNFNAHGAIGVEFGWGDQDYRANVAPGPGNTNLAGNINGNLETWTVRFLGNWHLLTGEFTPYLTGGFGWTYVDTNIPSGLPETFCWYYPWYGGTYCGAFVPTADTTKFSYNAGAGLRLDAGRGVFRAAVNMQYVDFGGNYGGSDYITTFRIDFGTKF